MDRRRREAQHTMPMTVRLTPDDDLLLKEVAHQKRIPAAILVRNWISEELEKYRAEHPDASKGDGNDQER